MNRLTKQQIEGIRLVADFLVIGDITDEVMAKVLTDKQLSDFKQHMRTSAPVPFEAGQELQRQIKEVSQIWRDSMAKDLQP
jgi:hypothetical protein